MKEILARTDRCVGCKTCELACSVAHSNTKDLIAAYLDSEQPVRRVHVETNPERTTNMPIQCRQCSDPKCVSACMTGAMYSDLESGLVLNNEAKCVGCWMCAMVCPYGTISQSEKRKVATKCDQCLSEGHDPACVRACPTNALKFIDVETFDKTVRKEFLVKFSTGEGV